MENTGGVMPTHIIAGAGIALNENGEILPIPDFGCPFPSYTVEG